MRPASSAYVTDTHAFLWYAAGDVSRLGRNAKLAFDAAESGKASIIIPSIALAEAAFIAEKGRVAVELESLLDLLESASNYTVYPLDFAIVRDASGLKRLGEIHDRIITATAKRLGLELISDDGEIRNSGYVRTIW